jgi:hypothetical protein
MKKAKLKEQKEIKSNVETGFSARHGIIVFLSVIVCFLGFYLLTDYLLDNRKQATDNSNNNEPAANEISFNKLLTQEKDDYYVLATLKSDKNESIYKMYTNTMDNIYFINMADAFNKNHIGDKTNIPEKVKDIVISDSTLFHIKSGKIDKYYVGSNEIINILKTLIKVTS